MLVEEKLKNIITYFCLGAYVPITVEGNIMVDRVLASCYDSIHHEVAHSLIKPVQWYLGMVEWIFGDGSGPSAYVGILEDVNRGVVPQGF